MDAAKCLIVLPSAVLGGAERVMFNVALEMGRQGRRVTVFCMTRGPQPGWEAIEGFPSLELVVRTHSSEKASLWDTLRFIYHESRRHKIDYVMSSHVHVNAFLSLLRRTGILRCRYLIARESTRVFERVRGLGRVAARILYFFYGQQDLLVCQTPSMKDSLITNIGEHRLPKTAVIRNPVNTQFIAQRLTEPSPLLPSKFIVACGRLVPIKDFMLLLRAFSASRLGARGFKLVIVGDGPQRLQLEEEAQNLELREDVIFLGKVPNPFPIFAKADVGVISSIKEGFPNVLFEMMYAGTRRVIATRCTDGLEQVHGIDTVPVGHVDAMAAAILDAASSDEDRSELYKRFIEENCASSSFLMSIEEQACLR